MDREAQLYDALRALTYAEMVAFGEQLRDCFQQDSVALGEASEWAKIVQMALEWYDARDEA